MSMACKPETVLKIENLSVSVGEINLIDSVSLTLNAGELLAVIGPNGAGKTTLLNTLVNQCQPAQSVRGDIYLCGQHYDKWSDSKRAQRVALLPQLSSLNFPYTVTEVIQLGRLPHSSGQEVDRELIQEALVALDIEHLQQRLYTQLSGGEKQRVQLARVMVQIWREEDAAQRLLILDEPTSSLDLGHQQQLMETIRKFADQGVAIIMVAHDINLVAHHADQLLALCCGRVLAYGNPEAVIDAELIEKLYQAKASVIAHPVTQKPVVLSV